MCKAPTRGQVTAEALANTMVAWSRGGNGDRVKAAGVMLPDTDGS